MVSPKELLLLMAERNNFDYNTQEFEDFLLDYFCLDESDEDNIESFVRRWLEYIHNDGIAYEEFI